MGYNVLFNHLVGIPNVALLAPPMVLRIFNAGTIGLHLHHLARSSQLNNFFLGKVKLKSREVFILYKLDPVTRPVEPSSIEVTLAWKPIVWTLTLLQPPLVYANSRNNGALTITGEIKYATQVGLTNIWWMLHKVTEKRLHIDFFNFYGLPTMHIGPKLRCMRRTLSTAVLK